MTMQVVVPSGGVYRPKKRKVVPPPDGIWLPDRGESGVVVPASFGGGGVVSHPRMRSFNPANLPNVLLVLDPRNLATMTQARDGTGAAPAADLDVVGRILDQSSNARIYNASTDSTRGRLRMNASVFDGKNCIEYDGTDDKMVPTANFGPAGAMTVAVEWATWTVPGASATWITMGTYNGTQSGTIFATNVATSETIAFGWGRTGAANLVGILGKNGAGASTSRRRIIITYDGSGTSSTSAYACYLNGVSQTVNTSVSSAQHSALGAMGANSGGAAPAKVQIGRVVYVDRVCSPGEISQLDSWLA